MRFFEDGDLTVGLKVAPNSHSIDFIEGEWHIMWAHVDGNQRTTNYDESNALLAMGVTIRSIEPSDKRKKAPNENISVELRFLQWGLEYRGHYNTEGPATKLSLAHNSTPNKVEADDDAYLVFGAVRDDQDFPFISFMTAVLPREANLQHYQNMEFVAKKTDEIGIHPLELTRNERLRLGFKMNNDGVFEDFSNSSSSVDIQSYLERARPGAVNVDLGENYTKLMQELKIHTEARAHIKQQLRDLKKRMDSEYKELNLSPSPSPGSHKKSAHTNRTNAASTTARAGGPKKRRASGTVKNSQRHSTGDGSLAPPRKGRKRQQTARARDALEKSRRTTVNGPVNGNVASSDEAEVSESEVSSEEGEEEEEEEDAGSRFSATAIDATAGASSAEDRAPPSGPGRRGRNPPSGPMRRCDLCSKEVTSKNWGVHINTNVHKNNVARGKRPRHNTQVNGDGDAMRSPLSPSAANKLQRPNNSLLRGGLSGLGRGRGSRSPS
ncbi:uncharacterized protein KY384_000608 [Bacidia gigantensis]|uniref:uncharacterized protein n=1 Tax=Bacidia gigantensis TaxID=2732470 RepID=UPI001D058199|nr:uncharacterized protein KY384_000608 [Bacidia gigantensis]KAG8525848.1 hypothetical protein KY384_000608 [Bacidia gigantensis]